MRMNLKRRHLMTAALAAASAPGWAQGLAGGGEDVALQAAVQGAWRSAANRARDGARHPYETLRFFGLAPQSRVIEISPGGGWYTEILAPYLRAQGWLFAAHESADDPQESRRNSRRAFDQKLAARSDVYDRVAVGLMPRGARFADPLPAGGVDLVLTFRNLHNWIEAGQIDTLLQAFYAALRPGGVLGVEEHRAPPGSSVEWIRKNGYVTEELAIERARAAGFQLAARSEVNANPRDTKNHPNGVWSLPPTLRGGDVDRDRFLAIGESDRFTHRYVKPAA
jgi:predicted methyltransferase